MNTSPVRRRLSVSPRSLVTWIGVAAALVVGCADRTHLTRTHGRAYHEAFRRQAVNDKPVATDPKSVEGLDSQESSIVAENYRKSLSPADSGGSAAPQPMVIMSPNATATPSGARMPAPSVPSDSR